MPSEKPEASYSFDVDSETKRFQARFIVLGARYFDYQSPMKAEIPGLECFAGKVIHPQFWPADYDYSDKKIAMIGSGATATTLLPALAEDAARVAMVQRSPSSLAGFCERLRQALNLALFVTFCHYFSARPRDVMRKSTVSQLPEWIVTGRIDRVTEGGIRMEDGSMVDTDVIVATTGLNMKIRGDIDLRVDGEPVIWGEKLACNVAMIEDVPNTGFMFGYADGAWTLGFDNAIMISSASASSWSARGSHP
ncbi:hypothetical protein DL771_007927 [Monosporascus sp. 5C6A]|nr:hypothetical protein DL771_007927 [Monosporascus sp. 5C6A]